MKSDNSTLRASYHTLGCKLNFSESSTIVKILSERGIRRVMPGETPDICIVNTCSVTETADRKGRQLIRRLASRYPLATIVVTGCYAQLKPDEVAALPGVEIVLGSNEKLRIAEFIDRWLDDRQAMIATTPALKIERFMPSCERGDRTRYFLKVQDGCDYFCTYCTIPFARGRSRSGRISDLVDMARDVVAAGGHEIVVTGVNTGEFGRDTGENFLDLLRRLDEVEGISRYRISSIEPNLLTDSIIRWISEQSRAFMPHFHVPLQSGSDVVLKLMNRRYDTALFAEKMHAIRESVPDAFIGVDVIAGARGETEAEWEKSLEFIGSLPITRLHAFPYSERPGTKALMLGDVIDAGERHRRVGLLNKLSDEKLGEFSRRFFGKVRSVLWESRHGDEIHGLTDNYLRVMAAAKDREENSVSDVCLKGFAGSIELLAGI